jgi:hypothetical protein
VGSEGRVRLAPRLTVYHRVHCGLCEQMLAELTSLQSRYTFALERVDIDEDPDLSTRFNAQVPVLAVDGEILCCHFLDAPALIDELTRND